LPSTIWATKFRSGGRGSQFAIGLVLQREQHLAQQHEPLQRRSRPPLACVVVGGMLLSQIYSLLVIPRWRGW
jgi:hypothetical protein